MKNTLNIALIEVPDDESFLLVRGVIIRRGDGYIIAQYHSDGRLFQVKARVAAEGQHFPEADYIAEKPTRIQAKAPRRDVLRESWVLMETLSA